MIPRVMCKLVWLAGASVAHSYPEYSPAYLLTMVGYSRQCADHRQILLSVCVVMLRIWDRLKCNEVDCYNDMTTECFPTEEHWQCAILHITFGVREYG